MLVGLSVTGATYSRSSSVDMPRVVSRARSAAALGAGRALPYDSGRLAELEELAQIGSWEWDVVTDRVTWSAQMYRIFGVKPDAFAATYAAYLDCLHPDDRPLATHNVERALRFIEPYEAEYRAVWPDGELRWLHCRGRAIVDDDGAVLRLLGTSQDITERKQLEARLAHRALHDDLTGLPNRSLLMDRLSVAMQRTERSGLHTLVLFVDLDRFKSVNDGAGHEAGDEVLRTIAGRLRDTVRQVDTVARYGGDEFVVVAEELRPEEAESFAARVLSVASLPIEHRSGRLSLSASIGGTVATRGRAPEEVLRNADAAMYEAKSRGGHRVAWVDVSGTS